MPNSGDVMDEFHHCACAEHVSVVQTFFVPGNDFFVPGSINWHAHGHASVIKHPSKKKEKKVQTD